MHQVSTSNELPTSSPQGTQLAMTNVVVPDIAQVKTNDLAADLAPIDKVLLPQALPPTKMENSSKEDPIAPAILVASSCNKLNETPAEKNFIKADRPTIDNQLLSCNKKKETKEDCIAPAISLLHPSSKNLNEAKENCPTPKISSSVPSKVSETNKTYKTSDILTPSSMNIIDKKEDCVAPSISSSSCNKVNEIHLNSGNEFKAFLNDNASTKDSTAFKAVLSSSQSDIDKLTKINEELLLYEGMLDNDSSSDIDSTIEGKLLIDESSLSENDELNNDVLRNTELLKQDLSHSITKDKLDLIQDTEKLIEKPLSSFEAKLSFQEQQDCSRLLSADDKTNPKICPESMEPTLSPNKTTPQICPESMEPSLSPIKTSPQTCPESMEPSLSPNKTSPQTCPESMEPSLSPNKTSPQTCPESMEPSLSPIKTSPQTCPESMEPSLSPNKTSPQTCPESMEPTLSPNKTSPQTCPESMEPSLSPNKTSPQTCPESMEPSLSPNKTSPQTCPESMEPTLSPNHQISNNTVTSSKSQSSLIENVSDDVSKGLHMIQDSPPLTDTKTTNSNEASQITEKPLTPNVICLKPEVTESQQELLQNNNLTNDFSISPNVQKPQVKKEKIDDFETAEIDKESPMKAVINKKPVEEGSLDGNPRKAEDIRESTLPIKTIQQPAKNQLKVVREIPATQNKVNSDTPSSGNWPSTTTKEVRAIKTEIIPSSETSTNSKMTNPDVSPLDQRRSAIIATDNQNIKTDLSFPVVDINLPFKSICPLSIKQNISQPILSSSVQSQDMTKQPSINQSDNLSPLLTSNNKTLDPQILSEGPSNRNMTTINYNMVSTNASKSLSTDLNKITRGGQLETRIPSGETSESCVTAVAPQTASPDSTTYAAEEFQKVSFVLIENCFVCLSCLKRFSCDSGFKKHVWHHLHPRISHLQLCKHCHSSKDTMLCPAVNEILSTLKNSHSKEVSSLRLKLQLNPPEEVKKNLRDATVINKELTPTKTQATPCAPNSISKSGVIKWSDSGKNQYLTFFIYGEKLICTNCHKGVLSSELTRHIHDHLCNPEILVYHSGCVGADTCILMSQIIPLIPSKEFRKNIFLILDISWRFTVNGDLAFRAMLVHHRAQNVIPFINQILFRTFKNDMKIIKSSEFVIPKASVEKNKQNSTGFGCQGKKGQDVTNRILSESLSNSLRKIKDGFKTLTLAVDNGYYICKDCKKNYVDLTLMKAHIMWHFHSLEKICCLTHYDGLLTHDNICPILSNIMTCVPKTKTETKEIIISWKPTSATKTLFKVQTLHKNLFIDLTLENSDEDSSLLTGSTPNSTEPEPRNRISLDTETIVISDDKVDPPSIHGEQTSKESSHSDINFCQDGTQPQNPAWQQNPQIQTSNRIKEFSPTQKKSSLPALPNISTRVPVSNCENINPKIPATSCLPSNSGGFYICGFPACKFSSIEEINFKNHIRELHEKEREFPCIHCGHNETSLDLLLRHLDTHANQTLFLLYYCSLCEYATNILMDFKKHVDAEHPMNSKFTCRYCRQNFEGIKFFLQHLEKNLLKFILCPHCKARDTHRKRMLLHIKNHHPDKPRKIVVTSQIICKTLNENRQLKNGIKAEETEKEAPAEKMAAAGEEIPRTSNVIIIEDENLNDAQKFSKDTTSKHLKPLLEDNKNPSKTEKPKILETEKKASAEKMATAEEETPRTSVIIIEDENLNDAQKFSKDTTSKHLKLLLEDKDSKENPSKIEKPKLLEILLNNNLLNCNKDLPAKQRIENGIRNGKRPTEKEPLEVHCNRKDLNNQNNILAEFQREPGNINVNPAVSNEKILEPLSLVKSQGLNLRNPVIRDSNQKGGCIPGEYANEGDKGQSPNVLQKLIEISSRIEGGNITREMEQAIEKQTPEFVQNYLNLKKLDKKLLCQPKIILWKTNITEEKSVNKNPSEKPVCAAPARDRNLFQLFEEKENRDSKDLSPNPKIPDNEMPVLVREEPFLASTTVPSITTDEEKDDSANDTSSYIDDSEEFQTPSLLQEVSLAGTTLDLHLQKCYSRSLQKDSKSLTCIICTEVKKTLYWMHFHLLSDHFKWPLWECQECGVRVYSHSKITTHCWRVHKNESPRIKSLDLPIIELDSNNEFFVSNKQPEFQPPKPQTLSSEVNGKKSSKPAQSSTLVNSKPKKDKPPSADPTASPPIPARSRKRSKSNDSEATPKKHKSSASETSVIPILEMCNPPPGSVEPAARVNVADTTALVASKTSKDNNEGQPVKKKTRLSSSTQPDPSEKKCPLCKFSCNQKSELSFLRHLILEHPKKFQQLINDKDIEKMEDAITGNSSKGFICPLCNENINQRVDCKIHIWRLHGQLKLIYCTECEYVTWFQRHMKLHTEQNHMLKSESCPKQTPNSSQNSNSRNQTLSSDKTKSQKHTEATTPPTVLPKAPEPNKLSNFERDKNSSLNTNSKIVSLFEKEMQDIDYQMAKKISDGVSKLKKSLVTRTALTIKSEKSSNADNSVNRTKNPKQPKPLNISTETTVKSKSPKLCTRSTSALKASSSHTKNSTPLKTTDSLTLKGKNSKPLIHSSPPFKLNPCKKSQKRPKDDGSTEPSTKSKTPKLFLQSSPPLKPSGPLSKISKQSKISESPSITSTKPKTPNPSAKPDLPPFRISNFNRNAQKETFPLNSSDKQSSKSSHKEKDPFSRLHPKTPVQTKPSTQSILKKILPKPVFPLSKNFVPNNPEFPTKTGSGLHSSERTSAGPFIETSCPKTGRKLYTCSICPVVRYTVFEIITHWKKHRDVLYQCSLCPYKKHNRDHVFQHVRFEHHNNGRVLSTSGNSQKGRSKLEWKNSIKK